MKRYGLAIVILYLFLSSCSISPAPPRKIIFINAHPELGKVHVKSMPIAINSSNCKPVFDRLSVYAQTGKFELTMIPGYIWADTPCNMVKNSLVEAFSQAGYRVIDFSKNRLFFTLFEFQPVFEKDKIYCKILAKFTLKTSNKIRTMLYHKERSIEKKSQFVDCLNTLVNDMDSAVLDWVYANLRAEH